MRSHDFLCENECYGCYLSPKKYLKDLLFYPVLIFVCKVDSEETIVSS